MLSVIEVVRVCSCNSFLKFSRFNAHQSLGIEGFKVIKESAKKGFKITKFSKKIVVLWKLT